MRRAFGIAVFVLLLTAPDGERTNDERPSRRDPNRSTVGVVERRPVGIRLNLSVTPTDLGLTDSPSAVGLVAPLSTPLSKVRLLSNEHFTADLRGGRIEYRIEGFNPLGASVGGQLSTNTAKITLS